MKNRDYYFDNAKFILIFFVVFGHMLRSYIESDGAILNFYKLIYTFHMPAFILISGFFAKGIYQKGYISKIAKKLILPYLIFQLIYSVFYYYLYGKSTFSINLLEPHWSLWFLLSLFFWNIMLLGFNKLKPAAALTISFALGLLIGYVDAAAEYLSITRTFVFFPLFLLGFYLKKEHFAVMRSKGSKIFSAAAIVAVAAGIALFPNLDEAWLLGSKPYSELEAITFYGLLKRMGIYAINLLMIWCFFSFVPKRRFFFTKWGKNTLYVYLLHGFIIRIFRESTVQDYVYNAQTITILLAASLILTILLSSKPVTSAAQPIIELKGTKWKRAKEHLTSYARTAKQKLQNG